MYQKDNKVWINKTNYIIGYFTSPQDVSLIPDTNDDLIHPKLEWISN